MIEDNVYFDWECNVCDDCCCCVSCKEHPSKKISSQGKQMIVCKKGLEPNWIPVKAHEHDMSKLKAMFGGE